MFGLTLGRLGVVGGLKKKFSPMRLFAASEVGVWYDPSDLSTMFQDSAGTTPVTADGQPVGLILDKSKGLVLGSELVTNGGFDSDTAWVKQPGWTIAAGLATFTPGTSGFIYQNSVVTAGKTLQITVTVTQGDLVFLDSQFYGQVVCGVGTHTLHIASRFTDINLWANTLTSIDSITVKEVAGNHAYQATAASRPLKTSTGAADWTNYDAVDDVLNTTFTSSLGSSCTVCRANVGGAPTILTGQTIGTSYADSTDNAGLIIINRALTAQETTDVTAWLTAKGAT